MINLDFVWFGGCHGPNFIDKIVCLFKEHLIYTIFWKVGISSSIYIMAEQSHGISIYFPKQDSWPISSSNRF